MLDEWVRNGPVALSESRMVAKLVENSGGQESSEPAGGKSAAKTDGLEEQGPAEQPGGGLDAVRRPIVVAMRWRTMMNMD